MTDERVLVTGGTGCIGSWVVRNLVQEHIPVVVLTSSRETADINLAYDLGANSYLVKPVAFDALLEMVKTLGLYWLMLNVRPAIRID